MASNSDFTVEDKMQYFEYLNLLSSGKKYNELYFTPPNDQGNKAKFQKMLKWLNVSSPLTWDKTQHHW